MARTNSRSTKMEVAITFRGTEEDKINIKLAAQRSGLDLSGFIRQLLIRERVITPLWANQANDRSYPPDKTDNAKQKENTNQSQCVKQDKDDSSWKLN